MQPHSLCDRSHLNSRFTPRACAGCSVTQGTVRDDGAHDILYMPTSSARADREAMIHLTVPIPQITTHTTPSEARGHLKRKQPPCVCGPSAKQHPLKSMFSFKVFRRGAKTGFIGRFPWNDWHRKIPRSRGRARISSCFASETVSLPSTAIAELPGTYKTPKMRDPTASRQQEQ